jgi:hypothetical protein
MGDAGYNFLKKNPPYASDVSFWIDYVKPRDLLKTYLHLLLPLASAESIEIKYGNGVEWRTGFIEPSNISLQSLRELVVSQSTDSDLFFDLANPKIPLVKPLISGSSLFFYGSDLVYDLPLIFTRENFSVDLVNIASLIIHFSLKIENKLDFIEKMFNENGINYSNKGKLLEIYSN